MSTAKLLQVGSGEVFPIDDLPEDDEIKDSSQFAGLPQPLTSSGNNHLDAAAADDDEDDDEWQDVDIISEEWGGVTTPMTQMTDPHQVVQQ